MENTILIKTNASVTGRCSPTIVEAHPRSMLLGPCSAARAAPGEVKRRGQEEDAPSGVVLAFRLTDAFRGPRAAPGG